MVLKQEIALVTTFIYMKIYVQCSIAKRLKSEKLKYVTRTSSRIAAQWSIQLA